MRWTAYLGGASRSCCEGTSLAALAPQHRWACAAVGPTHAPLGFTGGSGLLVQLLPTAWQDCNLKGEWHQ